MTTVALAMNSGGVTESGTAGAAVGGLALALNALNALLLERLEGGANTLDPLRGIRVTKAELIAALARGEERESRRPDADEVATLAQWLDGGLARRWALSPFDAAALLVVLAPEIDPVYERAYAFLQDDIALIRPRVQLVVGLCGGGSPSRAAGLARFLPSAPLFRFGLLQFNEGELETPLAGRILRVSNAVLSLALPGSPVWAQRGDAHWASAASDSDDLGLPDDAATRPVWIFTADRSRHAAIHSALARRHGRPVLVVDLPELGGGPDARRMALELAQHAAIHDVPIVADATGVAEDSSLVATVIEAALAAGVASYVVASRPPSVELEGVFDVVPVRLLHQTERADAWRAALPDRDDPLLCDRLARLLPLSKPQIEAAVAVVGQSAEEHAVFRAAQDRYRSPSELGEHVPVVRTLRDLHFSDKTAAELAELAEKIRVHSRVRALTPLAAGCVALFTGPPGTGKTAGAEALAFETRRDIFRINASQTLDRYVGGTEKQIDRVFALADHGRLLSPDTILFIDEADWLFASRVEGKDSHDHYLNVRVNHLLQHLERFTGVAILATNLPNSLDEGFRRRWFQHVTFEKPDARARLEIWRRTVARAKLPHEVRSFEALAAAFPFTGGNIHNVVLHGSYLAVAAGTPLTMPHLVRSLVREYQKLGQELSEREVSLRLERHQHPAARREAMA